MKTTQFSCSRHTATFKRWLYSIAELVAKHRHDFTTALTLGFSDHEYYCHFDSGLQEILEEPLMSKYGKGQALGWLVAWPIATLFFLSAFSARQLALVSLHEYCCIANELY